MADISSKQQNMYILMYIHTYYFILCKYNVSALNNILQKTFPFVKCGSCMLAVNFDEISEK